MNRHAFHHRRPAQAGLHPYPRTVCSGTISSSRSPPGSPLREDHAVGPTTNDPESVGLYILEGSKPGAAAAAVWLSHTLIPLDTSGHGLLVRQTVRQACELHALLTALPGLSGTPHRVRCEPLCPPGSNIVCYAFRPLTPSPLADINRLNRAVYDRFSVSESRRVYDQRFFVSRTTLTPAQYRADTVRNFLDRLGVTTDQYEREGVFLLRSVLMNPWHDLAKNRGRCYLAELAAELYSAADDAIAQHHGPC